MSTLHTKMVPITKTDASQQIVYGVVYAPFVMDTEGEFMFPEDIQKMAHGYMRLKLDETIDTNHDRVANGSYPIESFIASGHPDYPDGAWVLAVKCSDQTWEKVEKGELNSFSFEAMTFPVECEIEIETFRDHVGVTQKGSSEQDHEHVFFLHVNAQGKVTKGWTDEVDGHIHQIAGGSRTKMSGAVSHNHRFAL